MSNRLPTMKEIQSLRDYGHGEEAAYWEWQLLNKNRKYDSPVAMPTVHVNKPAAPAQSGAPVAWRFTWANDSLREWQYLNAEPKTDKLRLGIPGVLNPDSGRKNWEPVYAAPQPSRPVVLEDEQAAKPEQAGWCYPQGGRTRFADIGDTVDAAVSDKMRAVYYMEPPSEFVTEVAKIARAASSQSKEK